jgi:hypothetical protein
MKKITTLSEQATVPQTESAFPAILSAATLPVLFWTDAGTIEEGTAKDAASSSVKMRGALDSGGEIKVWPLEEMFLLTPAPHGGHADRRSRLSRYLASEGISGGASSSERETLQSRRRDSIYLNFARHIRLLQYTPEPVIQENVAQFQQADRVLRALQGQLDQIISLPAKSGIKEFADFDKSTIDACREIIRALSSYLVEGQTRDENVYLVPSEDGTVLFKWIRNNKELSITVEQNLLQVQRWMPLTSYESEGYWEITPGQVREHFDWLTR